MALKWEKKIIIKLLFAGIMINNVVQYSKSKHDTNLFPWFVTDEYKKNFTSTNTIGDYLHCARYDF